MEISQARAGTSHPTLSNPAIQNALLTLSQTSPGFHVYAVQAF